MSREFLSARWPSSLRGKICPVCMQQISSRERTLIVPGLGYGGPGPHLTLPRTFALVKERSTSISPSEPLSPVVPNHIDFLDSRDLTSLPILRRETAPTHRLDIQDDQKLKATVTKFFDCSWFCASERPLPQRRHAPIVMAKIRRRRGEPNKGGTESMDSGRVSERCPSQKRNKKKGPQFCARGNRALAAGHSQEPTCK